MLKQKNVTPVSIEVLTKAIILGYRFHTRQILTP